MLPDGFAQKALAAVTHDRIAHLASDRESDPTWRPGTGCPREHREQLGSDPGPSIINCPELGSLPDATLWREAEPRLRSRAFPAPTRR